jgi:hypothetical protein
MKVEHVYYLAGILEGEGCFDFYRKKTKLASGGESISIYPRIQLNMNDRDIIERIVQLTGMGRVLGPYGEKRGDNLNAKGYYAWNIAGTKAADLMRQLHPYMGIRRQGKIEQVLAECRLAPV